MRFSETKSRSLAKAVSYRLLNFVVDSAVVYAFTRRLELTIGVVVITNFTSTLLYYGYDRYWNNIAWGRSKS